MFKKIEQLSLTITNYCNLQCSYCHQFKSEDSFFDSNNYKALNNFIRSLPLSDRVNIHLIGGEASLFPKKIKEIVKNIKKIERTDNVRFTFTTTTNASKIENIIKLFDEGVLYPNHTAISWDGIFSCSKSRKPKNTSFTDNFFNNKIKELSNSKYSNLTHITYAVTNDTVDHMYESLLFLLNNNIKNFSFYFIAQYDYSNKDFLNTLETQLRLIGDEFIKRYNNPLDRFNYHNWNVLYHRLNNPSDIFFRCNKMGKILGISIDGGIYPCSVFGDHKNYKLGDIFKGLNKYSLESFIDDFLEMPNCNYKQCGIFNCSECPALTSIVKNNIHDKIATSCLAKQKECDVFKDMIERIKISEYDRAHFWFVNENKIPVIDKNYSVKVSEYDLHKECIYPIGRSCHC